MNLAEFFHMTFVFWVLMDAVGTVPIFVGLLSHYEVKRQRQIIIREMIIALAIMTLFVFFGDNFLNLLHIDTPTLEIAGGTIIFLIALRLLFSTPSAENKIAAAKKEPLIVPLAVPSIAGPGILAAISLWSGLCESTMTLLFAVILAWLFSLPIVMLAPVLKKLLGMNGLIAAERLFGYLIALISIDMIIHGLVASFHA